MSENDVLKKLLSNPRVIGAYSLDTDTRLHIVLEETGITTAGGMRYENRDVGKVRSSDAVFCVFSRGLISEPDTFTFAVSDSKGNICGHNVPKLMPRESLSDVIWISDDFVMYPDVIPRDEPRFVLYSYAYSGLGFAEGLRNVRAFNPAISTDRMLKERFGITGERISSTIITADYLRSR